MNDRTTVASAPVRQCLSLDPTSKERIMTKMNPWRTGAALAATLAITYSVCTAGYALWPEQGIDFLNALFHGLDFRKLGTPMTFTFLMFLYPLIVFVVWGFLVGALYAWLRNLIHGDSGRG
jgi:hypothetical protein